MIKLKMYNENYWSLCRFPDKVAYLGEYKQCRLKKEWEKNFTSPEEIQRVSLSRSKNNIKNICLSNNFEYFATFTVSSKNADRFSLQEVQDLIKKRFKKIKRKYGDFKYIYITEKHEKGSFHFHGMVKGLPINELILFTDKDFIPYKLLNLVKNGEKIYHSLLFDDIGWNTFEKIKDYNKCCNYITKYITKDCVRNENNQIYFCSRGLSKGSDEYMVDYDLKQIFNNSNKVFENEYCQKIDFEIDKLSFEHNKNLFAYFNFNDLILSKDNNNNTNLLQLLTKTKINII